MRQKSSLSLFRPLLTIIFIFFTAWWLYITIHLRHGDHNSIHNQIFGAAYGIVALFGGFAGLIASKKWGGWRSQIGRALLLFALGLLAQEFGQLVYSYYTYVSKIDIPYPSWGDAGFFGSVLFYILGSLQLAKTAGVKFSLKQKKSKFIAGVLPLLLLSLSYVIFLRGYKFDFSSFSSDLRVFLDFGYPLGQAIYIAIALLTYLLSKRLLGGIMKSKILFVLFALLVQYVADFTFLNAVKNNSPYPGGANDLIYLIAYFVMSLALYSYMFTPSAPKAPAGDEAEK